MKKLIFIYILAFTSLAFANEEVLIENPNIVAQLNTIQSNLDKVSSSVMACLESGHEHSACLCQNKEIINHFNNNVEALFRENKALETHDLVRFKTTDGTWVTQSLKGLSKQASEGKPSCT
ncbi:MAG: hypothetical protein AB1Y26_02510 [Cycloclasticus sp.]